MGLLDILGFLGQGAGQIAAGQMRGQMAGEQILAQRRAQKDMMEFRRLQQRAEAEAATARAKQAEQDRALRAAMPLLQQFGNPDLLAQWERTGELPSRATAAAPILQAAGYQFDPSEITRGTAQPGVMPEGAASPFDFMQPEQETPWEPSYRYQPSFKTQIGQQRGETYGKRVEQQGEESKTRIKLMTAQEQDILQTLPLDKAILFAKKHNIEGATELLRQRANTESGRGAREERMVAVAEKGAGTREAAQTDAAKKWRAQLEHAKVTDAQKIDIARRAAAVSERLATVRETLGELAVAKNPYEIEALKQRANKDAEGLDFEQKATLKALLDNATATRRNAVGAETPLTPSERAGAAQRIMDTVDGWKAAADEASQGGVGAPTAAPASVTSAAPSQSAGSFTQQQLNDASRSIDAGTVDADLAAIPAQYRGRVKSAIAHVKKLRASKGKR